MSNFFKDKQLKATNNARIHNEYIVPTDVVINNQSSQLDPHYMSTISEMLTNRSAGDNWENRWFRESKSSLNGTYIDNEGIFLKQSRYYVQMNIPLRSGSGEVELRIVDSEGNVQLHSQTFYTGQNDKGDFVYAHLSGVMTISDDTTVFIQQRNELENIINGSDGVECTINLWRLNNKEQVWYSETDRIVDYDLIPPPDISLVLETVSGTPTLPNVGYDTYVDDQYVYLAHASGNNFTVVNKSDWSVVSDTPSLPNTGWGVHADDQYVYLAHQNAPYFTIVDKSDWSVVSGTPSLPSIGYGVYADEQYVYLAHQNGNNFTVVNKSDWSVVAGTPSLPNRGRGVYADDQYVYLAHRNSPCFTVVDKSDWSVVSGTPSLPGEGIGIHVDDRYVYLAHQGDPFFTVVDKSDWSVVSGTPSLSNSGYGVYADDQYVYLVHNLAPSFIVVDKLDWSVVSDTPSLPAAGYGVFTDEQYVYLTHSGAPCFTVYEIK